MSSAKCCPFRRGLNVSTLPWRHNEHDSVSSHQPRECLLIRLIGAGQRKHQSSASLAFVREIHRIPVNSPHKGPVTRKMFPFDDVIMLFRTAEAELRICLGLYSLSGKTSYRQISRSLEPARLGVIMIVSLWNLSGISAAVLPRCLSNFRAMGQVLNSNLAASRLHEILR